RRRTQVFPHRWITRRYSALANTDRGDIMASQTIVTIKATAPTIRAGHKQAFSRRIEQVAAQLKDARAQMHHAQAPVHAAEPDLLARRVECEVAVTQLAELADLLESLQEQP